MATGGDEVVMDTSHEVDYNIKYIITVGDVINKKDGELIVSQEHGLLFNGQLEKNVSLKSLRWISREPYMAFPHQPQYCIVVSYLEDDSDAVANIFFEMKNDNDEICTKCLNCMKDLLTVKYQAVTIDLEKVSSAVAVVFSQPIFMGKVKMSVVSAAEGNIDEAMEKSAGEVVEFLMILDLECVCLYSGVLTKPIHHLMFWEEEGVTSIERVKLTQKPGDTEKTVCLQTKTMSFSYTADGEIIKQIQNLIPKKKHLLTDPALMLELVPRLTSARTIPTFPGNKGQSGIPTGTENWGAPSYVNTSGGAEGWVENSQLVAESNIARRIEGQLANVEENFRGNEDIQNMWVAIEFDIKEIMDGGKVPSTDHRSGGLDADSGEHLEKTLNDVTDQIKENNLPVAISRIAACRDLFGTSSVSSIRKIFDKSDVDLLRALYFKSLCE